MNVLPRSMVRTKSIEELKELMPLKITADGEIFAVMADPEDIIVVGDLHPRVQIQLKAKEKLARSGMGQKDVRPDYLIEE